MDPTTAQIHPPLRPLVILDCEQNARIIPSKKFHFANEFFEGDVMMIFKSDPESEPLAKEKFKGKARMFEFQFQGKVSSPLPIPPLPPP